MKETDWVGYIIPVLGFLYLIFGNIFGSKKRPENEKQVSQTFGKADPLKDFLKNLNKEMDDLYEEDEEVVAPVKKVLPPPLVAKSNPKPPPIQTYNQTYKPVKNQYQTKSAQPHHQTVSEQVTSAFAGDLHASLDKKYGSYVQRVKVVEQSRGRRLVHAGLSKKDLIVIQEVMGSPLALKRPNSWI